jgi:hypothetical protein
VIVHIISLCLVGIFAFSTCSTKLTAASVRFSCREIQANNFLKNFKTETQAKALFLALLEDQIMDFDVFTKADPRRRGTHEACLNMRWNHLEDLARKFSREQLRDADIQVLLARMRTLKGQEDLALEHLRAALNQNARHSEALYYSARRAQKMGDRELERSLLRGLTLSDFKERTYMRELFDQSFERYSFLILSSEAKALVDGPWADLQRDSIRRIKRALEISDQLREPERMKKYFAEMWGRGDLGVLPDWALLRAANMHRHLNEGSKSLEYFDRYVKIKKTWEMQDFADLKTYVDLAEKEKSYLRLRRWTELLLQNKAFVQLRIDDRRKISDQHVLALEQGALDRKRPVFDLERAQRINTGRNELLLLSVEIILGQRKNIPPEAAYRNRNNALQKARSVLGFLQTTQRFQLDGAFWECWMNNTLERFSDAKASCDKVLVFFQRGENFYRAASLEEFFVLAQKLNERAKTLREYKARLKALAGDNQVHAEIRSRARASFEELP